MTLAFRMPSLRAVAPILLCILSLLGLFAGTGCQSVAWTRDYYRSSDGHIYPPTPDDTPVQFLDGFPARPHRRIGRFQLTTEATASFMHRAAEYNARKAGADAIVITSLRRIEKPWERYVPPTLTYGPAVAYHEHWENGPLHRHDHTTVISSPGIIPGYVERGLVVQHSIDAVMIRFTGP
jgi:hypothetical protein